MSQLAKSVGWYTERMWDENYAQDIARNFAVAALEEIAFLKNPKYESEEEWRVVLAPKKFDDIRFRSRRSLLSPYMSLGFAAQGPLVAGLSVIAGPSPHLDLSVRAAARRLAHKIEPPNSLGRFGNLMSGDWSPYNNRVRPTQVTESSW